MLLPVRIIHVCSRGKIYKQVRHYPTLPVRCVPPTSVILPLTYFNPTPDSTCALQGDVNAPLCSSSSSNTLDGLTQPAPTDFRHVRRSTADRASGGGLQRQLHG